MRNLLARHRAITGVAAVVLTGIIVSACAQGGSAAQQAANGSDTQASATGFHQLQINQPVPLVNWSQYRETLIEIELAQAHTVQTTSFFFNQGVQDPVSTCPSIGFGVASTTELTNPLQDDLQGPNGNAGVALAQPDPTNGVYSGNSTGTYVVCVNGDGTNYINYWEGFVQTVTGPAVWNESTHSVQLTGPSSVHVKTSAAG